MSKRITVDPRVCRGQAYIKGTHVPLVDGFLAHAFWTYPAAEQHGQLLHFLKNLSMLGGLVLLAWQDGTPTAHASAKSSAAG